MAQVLVFGSINMDLVVETSTFPRLGETLPGASFATHAGGKGANQAVAAARLGAKVTMLGRVGSDAFGRELKARLTAEGVATRWVNETPGVSTGIAAITVCNADNAIVVVSGANACLSAADLDAAEPAFAEADVVLRGHRRRQHLGHARGAARARPGRRRAIRRLRPGRVGARGGDPCLRGSGGSATAHR